MSKRRVVITGIGAVTPIGLGNEGLWEGIRRERSAVGSLTRFDPTPFRSHNAAEVNDFIPTDHLERKKAKRLDRFGQFSVTSALMALQDSGLDLDKALLFEPCPDRLCDGVARHQEWPDVGVPRGGPPGRELIVSGHQRAAPPARKTLA